MFEKIFEQRLVSRSIPIAGISGKVVDDTKDFTVPVAVPDEGKLMIIGVSKPSKFTPGSEFTVSVTVKNRGGTDDVFIRIKDKDTGRTLKETAHRASADASFGQSYKITLDQTTDFHGCVETGHVA